MTEIAPSRVSRRTVSRPSPSRVENSSGVSNRSWITSTFGVIDSFSAHTSALRRHATLVFGGIKEARKRNALYRVGYGRISAPAYLYTYIVSEIWVPNVSILCARTSLRALSACVRTEK
jgi:hypothetical protein